MAGGAFAAFLFNLLVLPRTTLGRTLGRDGEPRWNGLVAYPLAVALAYALFHPLIAAVAWAVMALGDPAASLAGSGSKGGARIPWNRGKSVAGSVAFLFAASSGAFGILCAPCLVQGRPVEVAACLVLAGGAAIVGAIVESLPLREDNLPVVLATGAALTLALPIL
jgi:dolichol kinase